MNALPLTAVFGLIAAAAAPAQWRPLAPATAPSPRSGLAMAGDFAGNTYVFGGRTSLGAAVPASNETWRFDGTAWQQLAPPTSLSGRYGSSLTFDAWRGVFVLYGGAPNGVSTASSETWEFDGAAWTQVITANAPAGLLDHAACFDPFRGRVVVYGGRVDATSVGASASTYEYDGVDWQLVVASGPGPLDGPSMCFHAGLGKVVLFGGTPSATAHGNDTTWLWDGVTWTQAAITGPRPVARTRASIVHDAARDVCVLAGGRSPWLGWSLDDTWEFDGTSWQQQVTTISHAEHCGLAYDLARQCVVRFGGLWSFASTLLGETWRYGADTVVIGSGCAGSSGVPMLAATTPPNLSLTWHVQLTNLAPSIPFALIALGLTELPGVPLASVGMPGCSAYVAPDVLVALPAFGSALFATNVPMHPGLLGTSLFAQGISIDPGVNAAGLTVSNAVAAFLGH